jgi:hypothetical protein
VSCERLRRGAPTGAALAPGSRPLTAPLPTRPRCPPTRSRRQTAKRAGCPGW